MTYARKTLISLQDTPYYHVVSRCVRRAWLWGNDPYAGKDYSHRKEWVLERLRRQACVFAIDICAYAVMANHYHLVLHVDCAQSKAWTLKEVVKRWTQLYSAPLLVTRWHRGEASEAERVHAEHIIETWRARLSDISWYMKSLNEHLARRANEEEGCRGRFWEGRFRSQALLDEAGLLTAMTYVDLNPIRAQAASTPEDSHFSSIYQRIAALKSEHPKERSSLDSRPPLRSFKTPQQRTQALPCVLEEYLVLVDWTGRAVRADKPGHIEVREPPILKRLNINPEAWTRSMQPEANVFGRALGKLNHLRLHATTLGQSWVRGLRHAEALYSR
jgi:REP element-mobilizing transposase RayT